MAHKDAPILKKQIREMLEKIPPADRLTILEPLCEKYRKESRTEVEKDLLNWKQKMKIPRVKTDY